MNTKIKTNSESVVCEHQLEFNHEFYWENTKIADYVSDYRKRLTSEMIHIRFNKFSVNKKEDIFNLNSIYFLLLNRLNSRLFPADVCLYFKFCVYKNFCQYLNFTVTI